MKIDSEYETYRNLVIGDIIFRYNSIIDIFKNDINYISNSDLREMVAECNILNAKIQKFDNDYYNE
jgi:hypothetical protein